MLIYKVTNLVNSKVYIGQTKKTLEKRQNSHIREVFKYNSNLVFHKAIRKYGEDNFEWEIIDTAETEEELNEKEIYWIRYHKSFGENGYNMSVGGAYGGNSILSIDDVLQIKEMIKNRVPIKDIARQYNVDRDVIARIKCGTHWSNIGEDVSNIKYSKRNNIKLSENDVTEIKLLIKEDKLTRQKIAELFGVSRGTIDAIRLGKIWNHIGEDLSNIKFRNTKERLTEDEVREIKLLLKEGTLPQAEIGRMYKVNDSTINFIKTGRTWKQVIV